MSSFEFDKTIDKFVAGFKKIRDMGYVKSHRSHNTGIGKTLEDLMNIKENNIDGPDFGNIELKSQRAYTSSLITLFTKAPTNPPGVNSVLRDRYGIINEKNPDLKKLHTSMYTYFNTTYKRWGFRLRPDDGERKLYLDVKNLITGYHEDLNIWYGYSILEEIINVKLRILAYVSANKKHVDDHEEFHFTDCKIFYGASFSKFMDLLKANKIQYDIRIGSYGSGANYGEVHDHGSGFRIRKENMLNIFEGMIEL